MIPALRSLAAQVTGQAISVFARFMTAPRAIWHGIEPVPRQRVYFANHSSNGDFVLIWTVLPTHLRRQTRPTLADQGVRERMRQLILGERGTVRRQIERPSGSEPLGGGHSRPEPLDDTSSHA